MTSLKFDELCSLCNEKSASVSSLAIEQNKSLAQLETALIFLSAQLRTGGTSSARKGQALLKKDRKFPRDVVFPKTVPVDSRITPPAQRFSIDFYLLPKFPPKRKDGPAVSTKLAGAVLVSPESSPPLSLPPPPLHTSTMMSTKVPLALLAPPPPPKPTSHTTTVPPPPPKPTSVPPPPPPKPTVPLTVVKPTEPPPFRKRPLEASSDPQQNGLSQRQAMLTKMMTGGGGGGSTSSLPPPPGPPSVTTIQKIDPARLAPPVTTTTVIGDLSKYEKMKRAGLPQGAIEHAMKKDGVDPARLFS